MLLVSTAGIQTGLKPPCGRVPGALFKFGAGEGGPGSCVFLWSWCSCAQTLPGVQPSGRHRPKALKQTLSCLSAKPNAFSSQNVKSWHRETKQMCGKAAGWEARVGQGIQRLHVTIIGAGISGD